jgi:hypothetical protein
VTESGDAWADPADAPILVLGSGQRCGSTLVQRLLTSHPEVLIWGEHGGHLRDLLAMHEILLQWDRHVSEPARRDFRKGGYDSWMANLLPGPEALRDAARSYLRALFAAPAAAAGSPRWGFKEVRFSFADAGALRSLFPGLVVIHVTRDPRDVVVSLDGWERAGGDWSREYTQAAIRYWVDITESFLGAASQPWVLSRRYEDVIADPQPFIADAARLLDTEAERFDASVFARPIRGRGGRLRKWTALPDDMRRLLDDDRIQAVAAAAGYR